MGKEAHMQFIRLILMMKFGAGAVLTALITLGLLVSLPFVDVSANELPIIGIFAITAAFQTLLFFGVKSRWQQHRNEKRQAKADAELSLAQIRKQQAANRAKYAAQARQQG